MKKLISTTLALSLTLSVSAPAFAFEPQFNDVPSSHWAASYISSAASDGAMTGVGDNNFAPSKTLSRAEYITLLTRAFYADDVATAENEISEKSIASTWYTAQSFVVRDKELWKDAKWERDARYGVGKLRRPDSMSYFYAKPLSQTLEQDITRIDMASIAGRIMLDKGVPAIDIATQTATLNAIPDGWSVEEDGQREMMALVYYYGIIGGVDGAGTFNPDGTVDRATAATIYTRLRDCVAQYYKEPEPEQNAVSEETTLPDGYLPIEDAAYPTVVSVDGNTKAPYATVEDSIVGTINETPVTLSIETHTAPVDYWSEHPELNGLIAQDEYNALVFTILNREWLYQSGFTLSDYKFAENGFTYDFQRYPNNFNAPCFTEGWGKDGTSSGRGIASLAMCLDGYGYPEADSVYKINVAEKDTRFFTVGYTDPLTKNNGAFAPIFAKFTPDMTDKEKVVILVEALCDKMVYSDGSEEQKDIRGALFYGWADPNPVIKGVCDDYAIMFRSICLAAGIPCIREATPRHAWNLVYADGEWYSVDVSSIDLGYDAEYKTVDFSDPLCYTHWMHNVVEEPTRVAQDYTREAMTIVTALYADTCQ